MESLTRWTSFVKVVSVNDVIVNDVIVGVAGAEERRNVRGKIFKIGAKNFFGGRRETLLVPVSVPVPVFLRPPELLPLRAETGPKF